jgi:Predicted transcriptional regulators
MVFDTIMVESAPQTAPVETKVNTSVEFALQVLGGKWKLLIVYHLLENDRLRFGELGRCMPGITQKMLTQQLRDLEADGLVLREVFAQVPPRVEYSLTELGREAKLVLERLCRFGKLAAQHNGVPLATCRLAENADLAAAAD